MWYHKTLRRKQAKHSDINHNSIFLNQAPKAKEIQNSNKEMGPNQMYKLLYSKGNDKPNENTTYRMGGNICKLWDRQRLNKLNIQTAHTAQYQRKKKTATQSKKSRRPKQIFLQRRQSNSWAYIWRKPWLEKTCAPQCS